MRHSKALRARGLTGAAYGISREQKRGDEGVSSEGAIVFHEAGNLISSCRIIQPIPGEVNKRRVGALRAGELYNSADAGLGDLIA